MNQEKDLKLLARWIYSVDEWKRFLKSERKERKSNVFYEAIAIFVLGGLVLNFLRSAPMLFSFLFSGVFAIIYAVIKFYLRMNAVKWSGNSFPFVNIMDDELVINNKRTAFNKDGKRLRKSVCKEVGGITILEITYEWMTRKGITFDEIRIPVPSGKHSEAMELCNKFLKNIKD